MSGADADGARPLITIAMPVFNAGRHLRASVMSVLDQTERDWELLLIDDGSTDNAFAGLANIEDPRIRRVSDGINLGLAARLNQSIDLARGRFFARMDSDDVSYPERLARQLTLLERNPEIDLCAVRCVAIDADDGLVGIMPHALTHEAICARPWIGFHLPHPTWLGRIEWFRRHRYASPGPYYCEDQELLLRSYSDSRFASTPEILFAYRVRNSINLAKSVKTRNTLFRLQLNRFLAARQYSFCVSAAAAAATRIVMDSLNALAQNFGSWGYHRYDAAAIEFGERQRWREISTHLDMAGERLE